MNVVRPTVFHPRAWNGPRREIVRNFAPSHTGDFFAPLQDQDRHAVKGAEWVFQSFHGRPNLSDFGFCENTIALRPNDGDWQPSKRVARAFFPFLSPCEAGATIRDRLGRHNSFSSVRNFIKPIDNVRPAEPRCRLPKAVVESKSEGSLRLSCISRAALDQMPCSPIVDQCFEGQSFFSAFGFRLRSLADPFGNWVDALRDLAEADSSSFSRLLEREAAPYAQRLAVLTLGGGIGPLDEKAAGPFCRRAHTHSRTICVEYQPILTAGLHLERRKKAISKLWHVSAFLRTSCGPVVSWSARRLVAWIKPDIG